MVIIFAVCYPLLSFNHLILRWPSRNEGLSYCFHPQLVSTGSPGPANGFSAGESGRNCLFKMKKVLLSKSVLGCLLVWLSCFFWESNWINKYLLIINNYFLSEWRTVKMTFQKKWWCGLSVLLHRFFLLGIFPVKRLTSEFET